MSVETKKAPTQKAPTEASVVKQASTQLGLSDEKRAKLAMLIAARDAAAKSSSFASSIREVYNSLPVATTRASGKKTTPTLLTLNVHPIKEVRGFTLNLGEPVNPYLLYEAYGERQARLILDVFSPAAVKESAKLIEERNPGSKLRGQPAKPKVIEYIMDYVTRHG
jgi:hypothetical protein